MIPKATTNERRSVFPLLLFLNARRSSTSNKETLEKYKETTPMSKETQGKQKAGEKVKIN